MTTATTATGAALLPLVHALLAEPLDELGVEALQAPIAEVTPQVARQHHLDIPWHPDQQNAGPPPEPLDDLFTGGP
jgi:hypothetical protein